MKWIVILFFSMHVYAFEFYNLLHSLESEKIEKTVQKNVIEYKVRKHRCFLSDIRARFDDNSTFTIYHNSPSWVYKQRYTKEEIENRIFYFATKDALYLLATKRDTKRFTLQSANPMYKVMNSIKIGTVVKETDDYLYFQPIHHDKIEVNLYDKLYKGNTSWINFGHSHKASYYKNLHYTIYIGDMVLSTVKKIYNLKHFMLASIPKLKGSDAMYHYNNRNTKEHIQYIQPNAIKYNQCSQIVNELL